MSYKDPEQQRQYQRERCARVRAAWIEENGPCVQCGSSDRLEVDHKDRAEKVSHNVWSWSPERRAEELSKCQVLCRVCHHEKTGAENRKPLVHGTMNAYKKKGCRCLPCVQAHNVPRDRWRRQRKAAGLPYT